jgi:hypothetical protein
MNVRIAAIPKRATISKANSALANNAKQKAGGSNLLPPAFYLF